MLTWLKELVAGKELAELDRWRVEHEHISRWFSPVPSVALVLAHMKAEVDGKPMFINASAARDKVLEMDRARERNTIERCAKVCKDRALQMEHEAGSADADSDDVTHLRATAWQLSVAENKIRALPNVEVRGEE
jgi:hypothetical protein